MKANLLIFGCFAAGILLGFCGMEPTWMHRSDLSVALLSVLIFQVGIGLGANDNLKEVVRSIRPRMLLSPSSRLSDRSSSPPAPRCCRAADRLRSVWPSEADSATTRSRRC